MSFRVGPPQRWGVKQAAGPFGQSLLSVQWHPTALDEAIKNAWLRPDGLSLRREREGRREGGDVNKGDRKNRGTERRSEQEDSGKVKKKKKRD